MAPTPVPILPFVFPCLRTEENLEGLEVEPFPMSGPDDEVVPQVIPVHVMPPPENRPAAQRTLRQPEVGLNGNIFD